ncbi:MAG: hypothetical protein AB1299_09380 [Thermoproteota archaeon]|nr:hypothetical protein [Candidatus Nitrosotenuis sp.]
MKSLSAGEKIISEFPIGSKFGSCILYITNFGVSVENRRLGMILNLAFDDVASFLPMTKHSARLSWQENNSTFEFIVNSANTDVLCAKYNEVYHAYVVAQQSLGIMQQRPQNITVTNPLEKILSVHDTA